MVELTLAQPVEAEDCYKIIDFGRKFQQEQGFTQWTDDYPNYQTIKVDIRDSKGFVVKVDGALAGYMCIDFDGEPAYDDIDGAWRSSDPYAVVHRMAFAPDFCGKGLSGSTWDLIKDYCRDRGVDYIRVDTDFPNERMQHVLEKNGFVRCGVITFQGSGKIAYDQIL